MEYQHSTVLLHEAVHGLNINPNGIYLDGTFGCSGHSKLILSKLSKHGKLFAIDRDLISIKLAQSLKDPRLHVIHGKFSNIKQYMDERNLLGKINGILLDLGISSYQLHDTSRGFSFMNDSPLDMRMDITSGITAAKWLKQAKFEDIMYVLKTFGEERFSYRIAKNIINQNLKKPIERTFELTSIISRSYSYLKKYKHSATRTFQAIRIYINNELEELKKVLDSSLTVLSKSGRLSIIAFHSLEDRIVKNFVKQHSCKQQILNKLPLTEIQISLMNYKKLKLKNFGKFKPSKEEIISNPSARSAILRIAEKL